MVRRRKSAVRAWALAIAAVASVSVMAHGRQTDEWDGRRAHASRAELETLLRQMEEVAASSAYSGELRSRARSEVGLIRSRLQEGDFQVGDRVTVYVEGQQEISGEYPVLTGQVLHLPVIGEISLTGVLRSELTEHLRTELSRYVRDPMVRASSSFRIAVVGAVSNPGFLLVESGAVLSDVLNRAGGTTAAADLMSLRVERGDRRLWSGQTLHDAIIEGRTLDQLSLRAGDRVVVPAMRQSNNPFAVVLRFVTSSTFLYFVFRRLL